jgi:hypothetical protein
MERAISQTSEFRARVTKVAFILVPGAVSESLGDDLGDVGGTFADCLGAGLRGTSDLSSTWSATLGAAILPAPDEPLATLGGFFCGGDAGALFAHLGGFDLMPSVVEPLDEDEMKYRTIRH